MLDDKAYYEEMLPVIECLADGAYKNGIDAQNQAMNDEFERGVVNAKKVWWAQAEAVTGFYNAYQNQPQRTEYLKIAEGVWNYIQKYVIDKKTGEWIEDISPDNTTKPNQALAHAWKCPYCSLPRKTKKTDTQNEKNAPEHHVQERFLLPINGVLPLFYPFNFSSILATCRKICLSVSLLLVSFSVSSFGLSVVVVAFFANPFSPAALMIAG